MPWASGRLRVAPAPAPAPVSSAMADDVREPAGARVDVDASRRARRPAPRRSPAVPLPWWASTSTHGHPVVARVAQRLRRDRGVVEVARAAVRRPASRGGRAAGTARTPRARPRRPASTAVSAQSAAATASPRPRADQRHRVVAVHPGQGVQRGRQPSGQPGESSPASGRRTARPGPGRPARRTPPRTSGSCDRREDVEQAGCVHEPQAVDRRAARPRRARVRRQGSEDRVDALGDLGARGVATPTQISAAGRGGGSPGTRPPACDRRHAASIGHPEASSGRMRGMPRARDLGVVIGTLPTGPTNSVLDVAGCRARPRHRRTATSPHRRRARHRPHRRHRALLLAEDAYQPAGARRRRGPQRCRRVHRLPHRCRVGRDRDAGPTSPRRCSSAGSTTPPARSSSSATRRSADDVVIPVVGECDDSFLNDCRRMQVTADDVRAARAAALASRGGGGATGGGRGRGRDRHVVLRLQGRHRHRVPGHPGGPHGRRCCCSPTSACARSASRSPACRSAGCLGPAATGREPAPPGRASAIVVTDAPVDGAGCATAGPPDRPRSGPDRLDRPPRQRRDLPRASAPGCAWTATAAPTGPTWSPGRALDPLFAATVEAAEEAVLNSMFTAPTTVGRDGHTSESLHVARGARRSWRCR